MRHNPFKFVLAPVLVVAATLATNTATAQTRLLNVPFSFTVGGQNWPAGSYSIERIGLQGFVTLESEDASHSLTLTLGPGDPAPTDTRIILKFDNLGRTYALRTVQYGPEISARLDDKAERSERVIEQIVRGQ